MHVRADLCVSEHQPPKQACDSHDVTHQDSLFTLQELKLQYGANKGKAYTEEEDRFILCQVHQLGYGQWDELKAAIRDHWRFRFDWFFKSRTPQVWPHPRLAAGKVTARTRTFS